MSKTCFYCGKELAANERCDCRNPYNASAGNPSSSAGPSGTGSSKTVRQTHAEKQAKKEQERQSRERAKEEARRFRQAERTAGPRPGPTPGSGFRFDWRSVIARLMSSSAYSATDSFPKKIGFSLLQTLFRPVTAIETFVQRYDLALSVFYLILFSLATGFVSLRFYDNTIVTFLEGTMLGIVIALALNGLFLLVFRFLSKIRLTMRQILSSFSASSLFMAIFFVIASASGSTMISFLLTMLSGIIAGTLLHFIALKVLTRLPSDQLVVNVIFVYVLFFSMLGVLINLLMPASIAV